MQPNKYQRIVLDDLRLFLARWRNCNDPVLAYRAHWDEKGAARMPAYQAQPHGAPQVCAKVPTAGGKTLIGIYALQEVLNALGKRRGEPRLCIWLVPSLSIKDQVLNRFNTAGDGYWLALREALGGQVSVLSKAQMLAGGGQFNADSVRDEVVISVLTYDSLRAKNKDDRKLYQQNGALASFSSNVAESESDADIDPESLVAAVASLNPVVVVDESHNATSELSREMLTLLNPSCVVELTATPRKGANIISFVDAMALRDAHMVKLPVVVRNLPDRHEVIAHAIDLRARLEAEAKAEQAAGGAYIRPIVLFQAEPKNKDDSLSFGKVRDELVKQHGIDPAWVKIKTAAVDELKGVNLLADDCPVRFIITVNALKEGWDCSFAYVLATLADRSSPVDVEQILGRILRQPHIRPHGRTPLNMSYVLTASAVFSQTLEKIVAGLNRAGFSRNDYRTPDLPAPMTNALERPASDVCGTPDLFNPIVPPPTHGSIPASIGAITLNPSPAEIDARTDVASSAPCSVDTTLQCGEAAAAHLDQAAAAQGGQYIAPEQREMMDSYPRRHDFAAEIEILRLPQFFRRVAADSLFAETEGGTLLDRDMLLERFRLADCDVNDFKPNLAAGDVAQIDLKALQVDGMADYEPTRVLLKTHEIRKLRDYLATLSPESKRQQLAGLVSNWLGKMPPLGEPDLRAYIDKLLGRMTAAEIEGVLEQQHAFVEAVRKRVRLEMAGYRRKTFAQWVRNQEVFAADGFAFPSEVHPVDLYPPSANTLYEREERARSTNLESRMADWLAAAENVRWWHRNHQTRGYCLNGSINH
ncbi:MAG: DEAD/DEAH box helicase family protein, partial [Chitinimonas sp.]|nr:DEAD/DEAH box helicase family protein [Chitinimonas sp.]